MSTKKTPSKSRSWLAARKLAVRRRLWAALDGDLDLLEAFVALVESVSDKAVRS